MTVPRTQYLVSRARERPEGNARWDAPAWRGTPALGIEHHMGEAPAHRPRTQARLLYDDEFLYAIFRVEDRYVRAVVAEYQGPVCTDSCVELFLTPGGSLADGYFNIEVSCVGVALFMHQQARDTDVRAVEPSDAERLCISHTMPSRVEPEIQTPVTWLIEYRVPYAVLSRYAPVVQPAPGVTWRANLYKCADLSSQPHWLTWAPVDWLKPDFHRKEFFGFLAFGG
jgi:hypothetical protein